MIDHVNNLKLQHLVELSKLGDRCAGIEEEIEGWLAEHDVVFAGNTIPFVLMPHFVSPGQLRRVKRAVACLSQVLDRFCDAYAEDERLRDELALPAAEDALIRLDPGFSRPLKICRLDAFLQGYEVKFLEFNADSPAGIGYTDVLYEGLRRAIELPRVSAEFETSYTPMLPVLMETLLAAYRELRGERSDLPETPRLALVDVEGSPSVPEFRIICGAAKAAGIEALHATLDEVDLRRLAAARAGRAGASRLPPRAARGPARGRPDRRRARPQRRGREPVPARGSRTTRSCSRCWPTSASPTWWSPTSGARSRRRSPGRACCATGRAAYGDWVVDLLAFVSDNRERLVLKPASDYGGHGVSLGMETPQAEWDRLIEEHVGQGDYVVQEYVPVPEEMFPAVEDGHVQMRLKRFNINPFGLGGRYAGMITRISDKAVINVSAGGGLLPSVVGRHRERLLAEEGADEETAGLRR